MLQHYNIKLTPSFLKGNNITYKLVELRVISDMFKHKKLTNEYFMPDLRSDTATITNTYEKNETKSYNKTFLFSNFGWNCSNA